MFASVLDLGFGSCVQEAQQRKSGKTSEGRGGGVEQPEEKQKEGCALALGHKKEAAARL